MATVSYEKIYSQFLSKITDYNLIASDDQDVYEILRDLLYSATAKPYILKLFDEFMLDDEVIQLTYSLKHVINEADEDMRFVIEVIAMGMVIEWLEPQVNSVLNTLQMFSGKEEKFYSQSNHLSELKDLLKQSEIKQRKLIRDRGYISNTYLSEGGL